MSRFRAMLFGLGGFTTGPGAHADDAAARQ